MADEKQKSVLRETDDEARRLARQLLRGARFGALAVLDPETGYPFSSRVLIGTDVDGAPVMLSSLLATHTKGLIADPRCSLLTGEPGKGDPLAWPRLTLVADADRIKSDTESHSRIRARFLRRHKKASLYVDFPDFSFFKLVPKWASLNGGFGKAYKISGTDFMVPDPLGAFSENLELQILDELNSLAGRVTNSFVKQYFNDKSVGWAVIGVDPFGLDFARRGQLHRYEFLQPFIEPNGLIEAYKLLLKDLR